MPVTIRKKGIYICVFEDIDTKRAWITNLDRFDLTLDYFFLRHPYISAAIVLTVITIFLSFIMYKVYTMEIKNITLDKHADAYKNHLEKTAVVLDETSKDEKKKLIKTNKLKRKVAT